MNAIHVFVLAALLVPSSAPVIAAERTAAAPSSHAADESLREAVWQKLFRAGAHVRYHEKMSDSVGNAAGWWRWAAIVMGVLSFGFPIIFYFTSANKWVNAGWAVLGLIALLLSIIDAASRNSDQYQQHAVLEQRWNSLKHDWDKLYLERDKVTPAELQIRFDLLSGEERAIESAEPSGEGGDALKQAYQEEAVARGVKIPGDDASS